MSARDDYPNLRRWREDHKADGNLRIIGMRGEIDNALAELDALRAQVPRWVPVTERAPQHGDTVLWLWPDGEIRLRKVTDFLGYTWVPSPSHWMPLPAPPEPEGV